MRITFTKEGALRYIGHLDVVRMWERAFRRAKLPLAYTLGFTPHPRLTFATPLALGATSEGELLDVYLRETLSTEELIERISRQLPGGCAVRGVDALPVEGATLTALTRWAAYGVMATEVLTAPGAAERAGAGGGGGSQAAQGSRWSRGDAVPAGAGAMQHSGVGDADEVPWRPVDERLPPPEPETTLPSTGEIATRIERFLAASSVPHERARDGKKIDLRPFVLALSVAPGKLAARGVPGRVWIDMVVGLDASGAGRPDEIAAAIGLRARTVHRRQVGLAGDPIPA